MSSVNTARLSARVVVIMVVSLQQTMGPHDHHCHRRWRLGTGGDSGVDDVGEHDTDCADGGGGVEDVAGPGVPTMMSKPRIPLRPNPVKPPLIGLRHTGQRPFIRSVPFEARRRVADMGVDA